MQGSRAIKLHPFYGGSVNHNLNLNFIIILGGFSGPIVALPRTGPRCLVQSEVRLTLFPGH